MSERITTTQRIALMRLDHAERGSSSFDDIGEGKYRIALRALHLRAPHLVEHESFIDDESFRITFEGRNAISNDVASKPRVKP